MWCESQNFPMLLKSLGMTQDTLSGWEVLTSRMCLQGTLQQQKCMHASVSLSPHGFRLWQMFILEARDWMNFIQLGMCAQKNLRASFPLQPLSAPITEKLHSAGRGDASWQDKTPMWWGHKPLPSASRKRQLTSLLCVCVCLVASPVWSCVKQHLHHPGCSSAVGPQPLYLKATYWWRFLHLSKLNGSSFQLSF